MAKFGNVIVTFNRKELLIESINSILKQSIAVEKIIVVDNCSSDGTYDLLHEQGILNIPQVEYYRLNDNIGGAGGFAYGLKKAMDFNLDWVTFSDDDAIYLPGYFNQIQEAIKTNPDVYAFTGTVRLENDDLQISHRRRVTDWNKIKMTNVPIEDYKENFYLDTFTFVGVTLSSKIIKKIGLPDKEYFIWWDDIEYSLRARKYTKIINVSKAVVLHKRAAPDLSKDYKEDWREYYGYRNQIVTKRKHAKNKIVVNIYLILWMIKKIIFVTSSFYKGHRVRLIKLYIRAFKDAYSNKMGLNQYYRP